MNSAVERFYKLIEQDYAHHIKCKVAVDDIENPNYDETKVMPAWFESCENMRNNFKTFKKEVSLKTLSLDELYRYLAAIGLIKKAFGTSKYRMECYELILKIDKKNTAISFKRAELLRDDGKYSKAITVYKKIVKIEPENHQAIFSISQCLHGQLDTVDDSDKVIEAFTLINQAIKLAPEEGDYWCQKESFLKNFHSSSHKDSQGSYSAYKDIYKLFYSSLEEVELDRLTCLRAILSLLQPEFSHNSWYHLFLNSKIHLCLNLALWYEAIETTDLLLSFLSEVIEHSKEELSEDDDLYHELEEDYIFLYSDKAKALHNMGKSNLAIENYLLALDRDHSDSIGDNISFIYAHLTRIYYSINEFENTEKYLNLYLARCDDKDSTWPPEIMQKAKLYNDLNLHPETVTTYQYALDLCKTENTPQFEQEIISIIDNLI